MNMKPAGNLVGTLFQDRGRLIFLYELQSKLLKGGYIGDLGFSGTI